MGTLRVHRIHSLEETLREMEIRSEERLKEEKKHFREILERKDRERTSEVDQYVQKLFDLQVNERGIPL